ncbi:MAG: long-chain fatty acid--CoA ligase [Mycobacteriales bacterium]
MTTGTNWAAVLEHHADRFPERPLAVCEGVPTTYGQMLDRVRRLAGGLRSRGIGRGDIVGLLAYNSTEFLEVIFAANYIGAVAMPVNWRLSPTEVAYILTNSRAKILVSEVALGHVAVPALAQAEQEVVGLAVDDLREPGWSTLAELRLAEPVPAAAQVQEGDLHRLMYTSGTTSHPKGVMITHENLMWKNMAHVVEFSVTAEDVGLVCGPLYHVGALDLTTTTVLYAGGTVVIHPRFDAERVVAEIERGRITNVWLPPAMLNAILALPDIERGDLGGLRFLIAGGEKMPEPLIKRVQDLFPNAWFVDAYGLTESVSGDTFLDRRFTLERRGSVGKPCLHLEVAIWDLDGEDTVPAGVTGEIVLRGPKLFRGYWRNPEATEAAFRGGWFHTGDIGYLDEDGFLYIVDRLKDMIISGGENIASIEVERVLYGYPGLREAAVVARPDERWGEVPVAYVAMEPGVQATEEQVVAHCRQQLAKFKAPSAVVFVDELPRNPSGKVLKRELRARKSDPGKG